MYTLASLFQFSKTILKDEGKMRDSKIGTGRLWWRGQDIGHAGGCLLTRGGGGGGGGAILYSMRILIGSFGMKHSQGGYGTPKSGQNLCANPSQSMAKFHAVLGSDLCAKPRKTIHKRPSHSETRLVGIYPDTPSSKRCRRG